MNKRLLKYEIIGTFFTFICASLLHFVYRWTNGAVWTIIIGAVNESVWEHIKIFALPYILWGIIELAVLQVPARRLIVTKTLGLYILSSITIVFFYSYTTIIGTSIVIVDIISVFVWVMLAHTISYKLMISKAKIEQFFTPACLALAIYLSMYISFTINPPHLELFRDPLTNLYGIIAIF